MYNHAFAKHPSDSGASPCFQDYIRKNGPVTVEEAQKLALYHPEFGYYAHNSVIGSQGDFITSPEISQLFGEMLAFWCIAQWQEAGMPQSLHLIEMGPGRGTLMQDILRIGEHQEGFIESLTISCVEICPNLYEQQQQALSDYPFVFWYKNLSEVPKGADFTILLANEFFDTLPVRQFVSHEERTVRYSEKENALIFSPPANPHSIKETCPMGEELMHEVMGHLTPGVALIIDYGDDTPPEARFGDTLQALFQHKPVNVLESLGFADISHQVDFHKLCSIATNFRFQPQGNFLLRLGIEHRLEKLLSIASPEQRFSLTTGATRLVAPTEMGQRFKVLEVFQW
ncbi:MAG: SAM-dependent methyltransferase [Alphaproteobacteria bacterium]